MPIRQLARAKTRINKGIFMVNTKKTGLTVLAVILLIISAVLFAYTTFIDGFSTYSVVCCILEAALCVTVFVYVIGGFAKKYALCYKLYFIAAAVLCIVDFVFFTYSGKSLYVFEIIVYFIWFAIDILLAFSTDLGRKKSLIAVSIPLVIFLAFAVVCAVIYLLHPDKDEYLYPAFSYFCSVPSCLLTLIMVCGKYTDKAIRKGPDADK